MTHEEFVMRAEQTARTAQGLRRLAAHVRRLYTAIRALQEDDNGFLYIGEVIQRARDDKTDTLAFATRVKTYYHRDRVALGDPLIPRGMPGRIASASQIGAPLTSAPSSGHAGPADPLAYPMPHPGHETIAYRFPGLDAGTNAARPGPVQVQSQTGQNGPKADGAAQTAALHARQRGRRVVPGG